MSRLAGTEPQHDNMDVTRWDSGEVVFAAGMAFSLGLVACCVALLGLALL
jgi:hypothetical protein